MHTANWPRDLRTWLLAGQTKGADKHRLRWIAQVVDHRMALRVMAVFAHGGAEPIQRAPTQVGDARVAFPPSAVRSLKAVDDHVQAVWLGGVRDVPHFPC